MIGASAGIMAYQPEIIGRRAARYRVRDRWRRALPLSLGAGTCCCWSGRRELGLVCTQTQAAGTTKGVPKHAVIGARRRAADPRSRAPWKFRPPATRRISPSPPCGASRPAASPAGKAGSRWEHAVPGLRRCTNASRPARRVAQPGVSKLGLNNVATWALVRAEFRVPTAPTQHQRTGDRPFHGDARQDRATICEGKWRETGSETWRPP